MNIKPKRTQTNANSIHNLLEFRRQVSVAATIPNGTRFGKVVVVRRIDGPGEAQYEVACDCGSTRIYPGAALKRGSAKACAIGGCRWSWTKHGLARSDGSRHPDYAIWKTMRQRCNNPRHHKYPSYGGRGIQVCNRWNSFEAFTEDMGPRPSKSHSIERKDNNGNYCPENCVWATRTQQARNCRTNRILEFDGKSMTVAEWAESLGVNKDFIHRRLSYGWSTERALTTPPFNRGQNNAIKH